MCVCRSQHRISCRPFRFPFHNHKYVKRENDTNIDAREKKTIKKNCIRLLVCEHFKLPMKQTTLIALRTCKVVM